jgi:CheY-like chemotaxis protein
MTRHILVVDDDPDIRATVSEILDLEGCDVSAASNGVEALREIETSPPCVVLLDMRMPVLDGWGVARELRARGVGVPIVVMTAAQDAGRWAREIEADGVLPKPFELDDLLTVVARYADCLPK